MKECRSKEIRMRENKGKLYEYVLFERLKNPDKEVGRIHSNVEVKKGDRIYMISNDIRYDFLVQEVFERIVDFERDMKVMYLDIFDVRILGEL